MTASRSLYRRRRDAKLDADAVRAAWVIYDRTGLSLRQVAGRIWEQYGFASPASCANSLYDSFRSLGYSRRDQVAAAVAASTIHGLRPRSGPLPGYLEMRAVRRRERGETHGRICAATLRRLGVEHGRPCRAHALDDSQFCWAHDPRTDAERRRILEQARARSPRGNGAAA
jgi:hypothetical protein